MRLSGKIGVDANGDVQRFINSFKNAAFVPFDNVFVLIPASKQGVDGGISVGSGNYEIAIMFIAISKLNAHGSVISYEYFAYPRIEMNDTAGIAVFIFDLPTDV